MAGNAASYLDWNGNTTLVGYDAVCCPDTALFADGTRNTLMFDPVYNLTTMKDTTGTTAVAYTKRDELAFRLDPMGLSVGYRYDAVGNRESMVAAQPARPRPAAAGRLENGRFAA